MNPFTFAFLLLAAQIQAPVSIPAVPSEYHWIPGAVLSLLGNVLLIILGGWYRSEQNRKHAELLLALNRHEKHILEETDKRYVRLPQMHSGRRAHQEG